MEQLQRPKKRISRTLLLGTVMLLLLLGILLGVLGATTYRSGMMERYHSQIQSLLRLTEDRIDVDDLKECIETGVASEKYRELQEYLDSMKNTCDIKFVYVVKPLNTDKKDNMMNVIAGVSDEERVLHADILAQLGELTGEEYSPEVASMYLQRMDRTSDITYYSNTTAFGYMYTGLMPLHDSNGDPVAILGIDIAMDEIHQTLSRYNTITGLSVLMLAILSSTFTYLWLERRIIRPIEKMERASLRFVESSRHTQNPDELEYTKPDIRTQDEMEVLSGSITNMAEDMKHYMKTLIKETAEKERIGAELNVATQIQADMLPRIFPAFPDRKEFDIYATMNPAKEVGGDFYDFFLIDDNHLAMVIADVSGKGVPAALFMVIAKTLIKNRAQMGGTPSEILSFVNDQLCEGNEAGLFVTVWLAILDLTTGKGLAANAGHEHPAVRRANGTFELIKYRHSPAVATMEGMVFREHEFELNPGDALYVYTDGVTEATNAQNVLFGEERTTEALNRKPNAPVSEILKTVKESIDSFVGDAVQFDDITMLGMEYYGKDGKKNG